MPYARVNDIQMYYEVHGQGEPLVLIMGLSMDCTMWKRMLEVVTPRFRTLIFDNRGAGRSDKPEAAYSIAGFAADTVGLMDIVGFDSAHILGASMGGMIAQELVLRYPERVRSLTLACTNCGGAQAVPAAPDIMALLMRRGEMTPEEMVRASVPILYSAKTRETHPERIEEDVQRRLQHPQPPHGYVNQLGAIMGFSTYDRLDQIKVPTLIIHGKEDVLVPPANATVLASRIPKAEVVLLDDAGHVFMTDQPEAAAKSFLDFLGRQIRA